MEQIITVIKDGKKTTRLGSDAFSCLKKIRLSQQNPKYKMFAEDVIRKLYIAMVRRELIT